MRMTALHLGGAACVVALCTASPAHAQQAGIAIAVVDAESGEAVPDAEIRIVNGSIGYDRILLTDANGQVRIEGLTTAGSYRVVVKGDAEGSDGAASREVALRANFTSSVTLRINRADNTIVVTGLRAVTGLNAVNAEVAASLGEKELVALPIEGRDVIGALVRLPNVVPSTGFFPEAPSISINGSNSLNTNYLIDGLDNNENFLGGLKFPVPLGFTREVTVLANSYSVEYGRTANGIVNYTTPSGSNEFHGEIYGLVRPGRPLDARSAFPRRDLTGNPVGDSFERYQAGASLGGPIARDQTFFYANYEFTRDRNVQTVDAPLLGVVENVTGNNEFHLGSFRIDHRLTDDWTLSLRANIGRVSVDRPGGALGGGNVTFPSAGSRQDRFSTLVAATATFSGNVWSYDGALQYSRFRWGYGKPISGAGPQVTIQGPSGLSAGVVGHPGFVFDSLEETWQTSHRVQRSIGEHTLTVGVDGINSNIGLLGGGNPDGNYTVRLTDAQLGALAQGGSGLDLGASAVLALDPAVVNYAVELRPQSFGTDQTQLAFYVEDEWQLTSRLTATLGLRYDYDSLSEEGGSGGDYDNIAPRFALNYRPDARSTLRFGAGLFYGKLSYAVVSDALQRNTRSPGFLNQLAQLQSLGLLPAQADLAEVTFDGNLAVSPDCATVSQCPAPDEVLQLRDTSVINEARILSPEGYDNPYSVQLSAGYQFQATDTITLGADLVYSRSHNLVRLRDLNAPASFSTDLANLTADNIALLQAAPDNASRLTLAQQLGLVRSQADADASRPVSLQPGGARQITVSETSGEAEYTALILQANKARGDDFYGFRLAYTLSSLENDTDDINFRASDGNDFASEWGPSANDRRHVISAVGFLYPTDGLTLTLAGLFQSGQPVNFVPDARIFGTQDLNGDGASFGENFVGNSDRYPGAQRNSGRLPWSATVDLGVRYALPVLGGRLEASADVFNLFNANNESGFANAATTSNQVQFGGGASFVQRNAGPPRQFQFGLAYKF
ncbi:TonB-dependent receptor [Croceicoccus sp. YJ47]|nr:TonB-dependent receptor [Croceicoccus sp. YJ47]